MLRGRLSILLAVTTVLGLSVGGSALASGRSDGSKPAPASIGKAIASLPAETLDRVGAGELASRAEFQIENLGGSASAAGKVHVLSYNAAWCPHCAANSWALAIALSRFGTLSGLRLIDTGTFYEKKLGAKPGFSHTKGISFIDAAYKSSMVKFEPVVGYGVEGNPLEKLSGAQRKLIKSFDPKLGFPAVAIGQDWGLLGSGYSPAVIAGKGPATIAKAIAQPQSPIAKAIDGEANVLTAAICTAVVKPPEDVCASPAVEKAAGRLPKH